MKPVFFRMILLITLVLCLGCQSLPKLKVSDVQLPVVLKLKTESGRVDLTDYHTESSIKTSSPDKIARNVIERMNFTTEVRTQGVSEDGGELKQTLSVTKKQGEMDMHDLAFPELGETIKVRYQSNGDVLEAGEFDRDGIFYVPRISLPKEPVNIGDTWTLNTTWTSSKNKIRMKLELVTIFKRLVECGKDVCADLEVSGRVRLPGLEKKVIQLESTLEGRILFAIRDGVEVWSEIRNRESMTVKGVTVKVEACMESILREPKRLNFNKTYNPKCQVPLPEKIAIPL